MFSIWIWPLFHLIIFWLKTVQCLFFSGGKFTKILISFGLEYWSKKLEKQTYMQGIGRHSIEDVRRMIVEVPITLFFYIPVSLCLSLSLFSSLSLTLYISHSLSVFLSRYCLIYFSWISLITGHWLCFWFSGRKEIPYGRSGKIL